MVIVGKKIYTKFENENKRKVSKNSVIAPTEGDMIEAQGVHWVQEEREGEPGTVWCTHSDIQTLEFS